MATAGDLINASLREIGVLAAGETPPAQDSLDALDTLNRLVDKWNAERLRMFAITRTTWSIAASDGSYTIGSGGDINVARPVYVDNVAYIDTSTTDPDSEVQLNILTEEGYARITQKDLTATQPSAAYYDASYSSDLANLVLWPTPTSSTLTGVIYTPTAISSFSATTTTVGLPPGYEEMIVTNLALRLAPSYGSKVHPELKERARDSIAVVRRSNKRLRDVDLDPGALIGSTQGYGYDIQRG